MRRILVVMMILALAFTLSCCGRKAKPAMTPAETAKPQVETGVSEEPPAGERPVTPIETSEEAEEALNDIHFAYDKYNLDDEATRTLGANGEYLLKHRNVDVLIEGHCDERGTEEYNLALGEKRAIAARDFLVRFGIDRSRISTISYGEERPADPASNEAAWSQNRRAHFAVK
ncbi:MAG: peptidoglycan-associated lipoprotein Pal [bacterium]